LRHRIGEVSKSKHTAQVNSSIGIDNVEISLLLEDDNDDEEGDSVKSFKTTTRSITSTAGIFARSGVDSRDNIGNGWVDG
jgi:hypothetical protein